MRLRLRDELQAELSGEGYRLEVTPGGVELEAARPAGLFHTQEDIRQIVAHAAQRHIAIVPEIEMPGHARAAIAAYPHLGVFPDEQRDLRPWPEWGVSEHIFSPRPATVAFLPTTVAGACRAARSPAHPSSAPRGDAPLTIG